MGRSRIWFLTLYLMVGGAAVFGADCALACSCMPIPRERMLPGMSDVFIGTVVSPARAQAAGSAQPSEPAAAPKQRDDGDAAQLGKWVYVDVKVEETLKGKAQGLVVVSTGADAGSCGYPLVEGKRYLLFLRRSQGIFRTGLCFDNVEGDAIAAAAAEVRKALAAPRPPVAKRGPGGETLPLPKKQPH